MLLVDAENVRRSIWPNVAADDLVRLCGPLARSRDDEVVIVFDGSPPDIVPPTGVRLAGEKGRSADDLIARIASTADTVEVASSDRGLRARLPAGTRCVGGGTFLRRLLAHGGAT